MSELDVGKLTNQDIQLCKAWVSFNGVGAIVINDSYNVSSITDNGVGNFTINFTTAMSDSNYALSGTAHSEGVSAGGLGRAETGTTVTSVQIHTYDLAGSLADLNATDVAIFGN